MMELADIRDLKSLDVSHIGSSPIGGTIFHVHTDTRLQTRIGTNYV